MIEDQDCNDAQFHTLYALSLAKSAIEAFESENPAIGNIETKTLATMSSSIFQIPVRERLQIFLQSSDLYDPEEVLDLIEVSELWLEKVVLYKLPYLGFGLSEFVEFPYNWFTLAIDSLYYFSFSFVPI